MIAFLAGSIPFGWLIGKIMGVDLRKVGSGNIGAANTLRALGLIPAVLTFILDFAKGFLPVFFASQFPADIRSVVCLAGVLGHDYSPFLRFKGGKGVATSLGGIIAINWKIGLVVLITWLVVFILFKIASVSSLASLATAPIFSLLWQGEYFLVFLIIFGLALLRHRTNIERLKSGEEKPIQLIKGRGGNNGD
ncbi:MAG: glycerol-3-phosphate 1-O-acyltransferase PlsY [Caldiserica bacterium]|nr:glycerol-3-phosphate 1-O-acyltransferase PlsY [Caldisericota bacterium]